MTECNTKPIEFSSLKRKKIQADFAGGKLTSDAGAVLLREVDRGLGLIDALNACIPDPRNQDLIVHKQRTLPAQIILDFDATDDLIHGNQFRLMLSSAAYVLMETLRRVGLKDTELAGAQVSTIRLKLLKIGARVCHSARRIVLHLASGYPLQLLFHKIVTRLQRCFNPSVVFR